METLAILLLLLFVYQLSMVNGCGPSNVDFGSTIFPTAQTSPGLQTPATGPTPAPTSNSFDDLCKLVACDFGTNGQLCGYSPDSGAKQWKISDGLLNNKDTGVERPAPGKAHYLGVVLNPGEYASIVSVPAAFTDGDSVVIDFYEATHGIVLQGCSNSITNCEDISNYGISLKDRSWQTGVYKVPPFTSKLFLVAKNKGTNIGAVGIDSITVEDDAFGTCTSINRKYQSVQKRREKNTKGRKIRI